MWDTLNRMITTAVDAWRMPWRSAGPWGGMAALSLPATLLFLAAFRLASDPAEIRRRRARATARLLEIALFRREALMTLGALRRFLAANAAYLARLLWPTAAGLAPLALWLGQVYECGAYRPPRPGEAVVVTARLTPGADPLAPDIGLRAEGPLRVEAGPVRAPARREVSWRVRALGAGAGRVSVTLNGREFLMSLPAGDDAARLAPRRAHGGFWSRVWQPSQPPLPADAPLAAIAVAAPRREYRWAGGELHWLGAWAVCSLFLALALMKPLGVAL